MSENKWTPGPWILRKDVTGGGDVGIYAPGHHRNVLAEAFCELRRIGEDARDEASANAHLIAASPALAEALENLLGAFNTPIFRRRIADNQFALEAIKAGVAALSLARGEAK